MLAGFAMRIISLLTDFGLLDPFVAEMKAVIFSICPEARIIDITHQVEKFNIRMGAFLLASAAPYFPRGTIHVAVIDPGVGSERRPIVVETKHAAYVGPDNGLLIPAVRHETIRHIYELTNHSLMRENISATFHGRDVFAPTAAHIACGTLPKDCGPEIFQYTQPSNAEPRFDGKSAACEVFYVDEFGNIVTNLTTDLLARLALRTGQKVFLKFGKKRLSARFVRTYTDLSSGEFGLLVGSHGFLEIVRREASAAKSLRIKIGSVVRVGSV
jgi:S-adenosylmethionine hydrolase